MNKRTLIVAALSTVFVGVAAVSTLALSATLLEVGTTKVASLNIDRITNELQERKDLQSRLETMQNEVRQEIERRQLSLNQLLGRRNELKPDSPDFAKVNADIRQLRAETNTFQQLKTLEIQAFLNANLKSLSDKVAAVAAEIAKEQGIGLVISELNPQFPTDIETVPTEQLQRAISARNVFYVAPTADLSSLIITRLDASYKAGK